MPLLPLSRTFARGALREPSVWVGSAVLAVLGPVLGGLGRSGALAQRDRLDGSWVTDVAWIGSVAGIVLATRWLQRSSGLRWDRSGIQRWRDDLALLIVVGALGASVGVWPAMVEGLGGQFLETVRLVVHLALIATLFLQFARGATVAWLAFLGVAVGGPVLASLAPASVRVGIAAATDPRFSDGSGWWMVGALCLASLALVSTPPPPHQSS